MTGLRNCTYCSAVYLRYFLRWTESADCRLTECTDCRWAECTGCRLSISPLVLTPESVSGFRTFRWRSSHMHRLDRLLLLIRRRPFRTALYSTRLKNPSFKSSHLSEKRSASPKGISSQPYTYVSATPHLESRVGKGSGVMNGVTM